MSISKETDLIKMKAWKLKKTCPDCEEEKINWPHFNNGGFCFEHRWENPYKLKRDKRELTKYWKILSILICFIYMLEIALFSILSIDIFEGKLLYLLTFFVRFLFIAWFSIYTYKEWKKVKKEFKEIKDKQNQWEKLS